MVQVSVVIVTIGAKNYLKLCLDSLLKQTQLACEIIIIDNSLRPELAREIIQSYPSVKVYPNSENLFYSASLNKGILLSQGEFIFCLNDDVILNEDFIQEAVKGFWVNEKIGLVGGKILRGAGKILDSTGLFLTPWRTARERGYGRLDSGQFEKSGYIFGVNGAVVIYRKKMLEEIKGINGYLDVNLRMFYEDLDISWRANKKGWFAYYLSTAKAYHVRGGSFRPDSGIDKPMARRYLNDQLHYELIKNRYLVIKNNENFLGFFLHLAPILLYDLFVWGYVLFFQPRLLKIFFLKLGNYFKRKIAKLCYTQKKELMF
ncbi:MAG: glycosyltransferase family 2 protein [Candidatus Omnitrophota bacterium]